MESLPERRLLGRHELVAEIAQGGMGMVYLARLEGMGGFQRLFAVKVLHPHLVREKAFVSMLLDEARLAARLHHPNAVSIVDVGEGPLGPYVVMEYVDGFTLEELLEKAPNPAERARLGIRLLLDASKGLHAAHNLVDDHGSPLDIVHRDVSPQNVLVGADGIGRITDFGVARAAARITSSRPGTVKGKPCYMAPEQARAEDIDARADIFAMGIMLWEILVGHSLFQCDADVATLMAVIHKPIPLPSHVVECPEELDAVTMHALARDPEERFSSARAFAKALERAARDANWVATNDEVADFIEEAFGEELAARREAVRGHLESLRGSVAVPIVASDVFAVPKLDGRLSLLDAESRGAWHETPAETARVDPTGKTVATLTSAPDHRAPAPAPARRTGLLAFALGLGGLAMLGVALFVLLREPADPPTPEEETTAEAPTAEAPTAEAEAPAAEAEAPTAEAEAPTAEAEAPTAETPTAETPTAEAGTAEADEPEVQRSRRGRRARMAPAMAEPTVETAPVSPMTGSTLETNPYLR
ncbi:MAG: serine/threonine protein kinase [Deltaproteobacteria bacterium]|nr:serine/threonine protein kinase [Deltaproteobacteria bacterium]